MAGGGATHGVTHDLQVEAVQFEAHLSVALTIPAVKVGGPEEAPETTGDRVLNFILCSQVNLPDSPVQTPPVPSQQGGELRPSVLQSGQEVLLTEGADLRRSLNTNTFSLLPRHTDTRSTSCLPSRASRTSAGASGWPCSAPVRQHTGLTAPPASHHLLSPELKASHQRDDEALRQLQQVSPQDGALHLRGSPPLDPLRTNQTAEDLLPVPPQVTSP